MHAPRYDAVTLDAYGTIFLGGSDDLIAILREVHEEARIRAPLESLLARREEMIHELTKRGFLTMRDRDDWILRTLFREHDVRADPAPVVARLYDTYFAAKPYPEALAEIDALRATGAKLAIVSNADVDMMRHLVAAHGLADAFAAVVTSESTRCYKPGGEIFEAASRALDVPPHRILHVGDSWTADVEGAKKAGYGGAVWIDRPGGLPPPRHPEARPDVTLPSLTGVASRVAPQP